MQFVRIGNRALNLDRISHCEVQVWHDTVSVKIFMAGTANNTSMVLNDEEAKQFWKYLEQMAEKPAQFWLHVTMHVSPPLPIPGPYHTEICSMM